MTWSLYWKSLTDSGHTPSSKRASKSGGASGQALSGQSRQRPEARSQAPATQRVGSSAQQPGKVASWQRPTTQRDSWHAVAATRARSRCRSGSSSSVGTSMQVPRALQRPS
ncbi:MAG: hypothetical protein U1F43_29895 [Myxococcota bacterium]